MGWFSAHEQPEVINSKPPIAQKGKAHIGRLERDHDQGRHDLFVVLATIKVFSGESIVPTARVHLSKVFPGHAVPRLCRTSLGEAIAPISTPRNVAAPVIKTKGWNGQYRRLRKAIAYKFVQIMRRDYRLAYVKRFGSMAVLEGDSPFKKRAFEITVATISREDNLLRHHRSSLTLATKKRGRTVARLLQNNPATTGCSRG
jgi:hypothetical protein